MKRIFACLLFWAALVMIYTARTRAGSPLIDFSDALPFLAGQIVLCHALNMFLKPGTALLWYLDLDINAPNVLFLNIFICWHLWLVLTRFGIFYVGRRLGLVPISWFGPTTRAAFPWRFFYRKYVRAARWVGQHKYGDGPTGCWMSLTGAANRLFSGGDQILLGRLWGKSIKFHQPVAAEGSGHFVMLAKTGAGKTLWGIGWIKQMAKDASAVVVDVGADIVNAIGQSLKNDGHPLFVLDFFGVSHFPCANWNMLDELTRAVQRHGKEAAVRFAFMLATALVPDDNPNQPIFAQGARQLLWGLILFVWLFEPVERRNLIRVVELASRGLPECVKNEKETPMERLAFYLKQAPKMIDDGCGGQITAVIANAASVLTHGANRSGGNPFLSSLLTATAWVNIPEIAKTLKTSDFSCADLKGGNACLFLNASVADIRTTLNGYVRALSTMMLYTFENIDLHLANPCLFFLDEAPHLKLEYLETAAPTARKAGIRLGIIAQDLAVLKMGHPKGWSILLSNALVVIFLATDHLETIEYLHKFCGEKLVKIRTAGSHWFWTLFGLSKEKATYQTVKQELISINQLREFLSVPRGQCIALIAGEPPVRLAWEGYLTGLAIWQYAPSKHYREKLLRALMRRILATLWLRVPPPADRQPAKAKV